MTEGFLSIVFKSVKAIQDNSRNLAMPFEYERLPVATSCYIENYVCQKTERNREN